MYYYIPTNLQQALLKKKSMKIETTKSYSSYRHFMIMCYKKEMIVNKQGSS